MYPGGREHVHTDEARHPAHEMCGNAQMRCLRGRGQVTAGSWNSVGSIPKGEMSVLGAPVHSPGLLCSRLMTNVLEASARCRM